MGISLRRNRRLARESDTIELGRLASLPEKRLTAMSIRRVLLRALIYWRPYWAIGILVLGLMAVQEAFETFYDVSIGQITDQVLIQRDGPALIRILELLGGAYLIAAIATVAGDFLTSVVGARILNNLRRQMFTQMQRLSMRYYAHAQAGDIVSRFTSDLAEIDKGLTVRFTDGNLALVGLTFNIPALIIINWKLALLALAATPLILIGPRIFTPAASRSFFRLKREQAALASAVQENARAQAIVKIFGLQNTMLARLANQLKDLYRRTVSATFITQTVGTTSSLGVRLAEVAIIGVGSYMAFKGYLSIGGLVAFILLLDDSTGDAYSLAKKVMPSIVAAGSGIQRIDEFLDEPSQVEDAPDAVPLAPLSQEIRFDDVSFAYEPDHPILDHVSFTIPAGQYAAFVGPTGAGKTSILNLLCRFYDVTSGAVRVDGHDVRGVTQDSLRSQMAAVLQETFLFNTSIRENIKLGKLSASEDEIVAAARAAEIHDAIEKLPHGYFTLTGEMGGLLSAGQRQRIAIARAILRDPRILILDEPTSDLDAATEATINATLERLAKDRTVVAVTHRLAAVLHADQIYVIDGGRIAEHGRHQDLLARRGLYYQLWQTQHAASPSDPA